MVFTELEIIEGVIITLEEIIKFLKEMGKEIPSGEGNPSPYDCCDLANSLLEENRGTIKIFPFECCSESSGKLYILGIKQGTYHRKVHRCKNCDEYSVCDKCIGSTSNGFYNVIKISEEPVEVNPKYICSSCFHDHRYENFVFCSSCGAEEEPYKTSSVFKRERYKSLLEGKQIKIYYRVNDCLSCT